MKIIFALGNPGTDYKNSRHNVGFMTLDTLAASLKADWVQKSRFTALIAEVTVGGEKTLLVKPTTFYNEAGASIRKIVDFYRIDHTSELLVVHDDVALPFSTIRVREQGSDAGNNGIKSLNTHLGSEYSRIRIGTDNELHAQMDDADFVLAKFSADETRKLEKDIIPQTIELIEQFCNDRIKITSYQT